MEVLTYKCPNCGAALEFNSESQQWDCKFCLSSFKQEQLETVTEAAQTAPCEAAATPTEEQAGEAAQKQAGEPPVVYICPNCGAQLVTDSVTAASFCVFCGSPAIFPQQLTGGFTPQYVIPFQYKREDVLARLKEICKKKKLLPRDFTQASHIEKVTGVYVPFWLFDCRAQGDLSARAQRVRTWRDSNYNYTETTHYAVERSGSSQFSKIPADGSAKMDNAIMDALEPFDYNGLLPFQMAYLSGYLAERYDQTSQQVQERMEERVRRTLRGLLEETVQGYTAKQVESCHVNIDVTKREYALLPVWVLATKYRDKYYMFTMNGQTGKIVGRYPVSWAKAALWFGGVTAAVAAAVFLGGLLL